jgi:imidazole glycerol-phosphate synthase subunit HisH
MNVVIVDYNQGNISSIKRAFKLLGVEVICSHDKTVIEGAEALVMPGVGNFRTAMNYINNNNIDSVLNHSVHKKKIPVLGICLGMQLMTNFSEEGEVDGLGWIQARVEKIIPKDKENYKVPNIGWTLLNKGINSELLDGIDCNKSPFYFCHSYAVRKISQSGLYTSSFYYDGEYVSIFECENIFGVQFHPEKSHSAGVDLLSNFLSKVRNRK